MKIDDFKKELENNNMQKDIKKSFESIFDSLTPKSIHIPIKEGFKIIRAFLKSQ